MNVPEWYRYGSDCPATGKAGAIMAYYETRRAEAGSSQPKTRPSIAVHEPLKAGQTLAEFRPLRQCHTILDQWHDLAKRALQPNVFYEPEFALAAAQHLVGSEAVNVLLIWHQSRFERVPRLVGFFPVTLPGGILASRKIVGMTSPYAASGVPLIDRSVAADVMELALRHLANHASHNGTYMLPQIDLDGEFSIALMAVLHKAGYRLTCINGEQRHVYNHQQLDASARQSMQDLARLQDMRTALAKLGRVTIREAASGPELRDAVEYFLALEASNWLGRTGRAIMLQTRTGAFLRAATRGLGRSHHCRVMTLALDDTPIAAALVYDDASRAWLVGLASDQAHKAHLPSELLIQAIIERQMRQGKIAITDLCALPANSTASTIWTQQRTIASMCIALSVTRPAGGGPTDRLSETMALRTGRYMRNLLRSSSRK